MRYSVDKDDPGYLAYMHRFGTQRPTVLLDGEDVTFRCVTADTERGEVVLLQIDGQGRYVLTEDGQDIARKTLTGNVTVQWADRNLSLH